MEAKYILLGCFFLLLLGCASQTQTQYVCADGTAVSDPSACPVGQILQKTSSSTQTFLCPDGEKVGDPADCLKCPSSCDDANPCTQETCSQNTGFSCQYTNLNGPQPNCGGAPTGCMQRTCSSGKCISEPQVPCCGNGKCEEGETCDSCAADCGCEQGALCCENKCKETSCSNDSDCNDHNESTVDTCTGTGCEAACQHTAITSCKNGDGTCPDGCSANTDADCPAYQLRQYANITDDLSVGVLSKATRHCFGEGRDAGKDYGYFLVLTVDFENSALSEKMVPVNTFTVFSNATQQYNSTDSVPGDCDTSGMFAGDSARVLSWKDSQGDLWFQVGKNELHCGFTAVLNKSAYGENGELVWSVPC